MTCAQHCSALYLIRIFENARLYIHYRPWIWLKKLTTVNSESFSHNRKNHCSFVVAFVVLDFPPLVILHLQYPFIFLRGSGLQCFLPRMPSSFQSLLDYGKTDGRPDVLLHLHYITSSCIAAQVLYLFSYVKALHAYDYEGKKYILSVSYQP